MNVAVLKSKSFLFPTIAWVLFVGLHLALFAAQERKHDSLVRTLIQWDGRLYLSIAADGYEKFPCEGHPHDICGNGGWFPFYPLIAAVVGLFGLDARYCMLAVSWLAFWLALLVLYRMARDLWGEREAVIGLLALLFFPGAFYFLTAFPYSVYLLLAALILYQLQRHRFTWLWLPSACLAVTYPSGSLIGLPLAWVLVRYWKRHSTADRIHLVGAVAAIPLAMVVYFSYYWLTLDDFWLYVKIQSQSYYAHEPAFPLLVIYRTLEQLPYWSPIGGALYFVILTTAAFYRRALPATWQLLLFGILLFTPTMGTPTCYYRHIVVALPLPFLVAMAWSHAWRRWLIPLYFLAAAVLNWGVYVPMYLDGMLM